MLPPRSYRSRKGLAAAARKARWPVKREDDFETLVAQGYEATSGSGVTPNLDSSAPVCSPDHKRARIDCELAVPPLWQLAGVPPATVCQSGSTISVLARASPADAAVKQSLISVHINLSDSDSPASFTDADHNTDTSALGAQSFESPIYRASPVPRKIFQAL